MFVEKMNKILHNFATVSRPKRVNLTCDEQKEGHVKAVCYLCGEKYNDNVKHF